ncbi:guanine(37)-N1-methyltransferase [Gorgonomyces haynaldii]|nr:guanine(37)-N1-methyltransferase [Gorgonomyces haynaldii]
MQPPSLKIINSLERFNRLLFTKQVDLRCLVVPAQLCKTIMSRFKNAGVLFNAPKLPTILEDPQRKQSRIVLLDPQLQVKTIDELPESLKELCKDNNCILDTHSLEIDYSYWTTEQVLRSILPDELEVPSAFETIGHIAHVNLRPEYDQYKQIIGQVILEKTRGIRTVVNKTGNIDNQFRFFEMELLAGEHDMKAELREGGCTFKFDFSKVYWNSRLSTEHERLASLFKQGDVVFDVMGGVGPFAIPASKNHGATVFCNDLNPNSHLALLENIKLNHVEDRVIGFEMDGRQFIRDSLQIANDEKYWKQLHAARVKKIEQSNRRKGQKNPIPDFKMEPKTIQHYIMNLPASAVEFLDAFSGIYRDQTVQEMPMIHCHMFSREKDRDQDCIQRAEHYLGHSLKGHVQMVHNVRNVAPNKDMMCISFRLPREVAFLSRKRKQD